MGFIRSKLGLIVWLLVVFVVLVVPQWRLRAGRQWAEPKFDLNRFPASFGLSPELELEGARRFPNDAAAQFATMHGLRYSVEESGSIPGTQSLHPSPRPTESLFEAKRRRRDAEYFGRYDALLRRFPDAQFGRIQRLRDVTRGSFAIDEGPPEPGTSPFPPEHQAPAWFSKSQREAALGVARDGAQRDSDNAFFPWMEATLNFSLKRDEQALEALDRAGRCAHFEDDVFGTSGRRLKVLYRLRATGWEDDSAETWGALLPHLSRMRQVARATMGRARQARKQNNEARALEITGKLQRAGFAMTRTDGTVITKLVGEASCMTAWQGIIEREPNPLKPPVFDSQSMLGTREYRAAVLQYQRQVAERFVVYTRAHGRPDLGHQAQNIVSQFDSQQLSDVYDAPWFDSQLAQARQLTKAFWLGGVMLLVGVGASAVWGVTWLLSGRGRDEAARRQTLLPIMFCVGATITILIMLSVWLPDTFANYEGQNTESKPPYALAALDDNLGLFLVLLWVVPVLAPLLIRRASGWRFPIRGSGETSPRRIVSALLWAGIVVGMSGVLFGSTQSRDSLFTVLFPYSAAMLLVCAVAGSVLWASWSSGHKRLSRLFFLGSLWMGLVTPFVWSGFDGTFYGPLLAFVCVVMLFTGVFFGRGELKSNFSGAFAFVREVAARARIASAALALLCAVGYMGIALWTIPVERQTRALLARQCKFGEVAVLREQLQKQNPALP